MDISEIFKKNIARPIHGVVLADQQSDPIVWQELDEYVVTKELDKHFRKYLDVYLSSVDAAHDPVLTSRMGVWVSGFFGSGKSHFIKILSHLLGNHNAHNPETGETRRATDFFTNKVEDSMLFADIKRVGQIDTDVVLFNIDSRADTSDGRSALLSVFWRVFNKMQGLCPTSLPLADLEFYLVKKGKYDAFCQAFEETHGTSWVEERDAHSFYKDEIVESLSKALGVPSQAAEEKLDKLEGQFTLSVERFADRIKEYLDSKGPSHRIVFLVDEVGQFIGSDTHLMLNLQTIVEELGRLCQGRAWVIVTSQEDIDAVLGDLKSSKANDFSKIQGRFHTRLSLSSSNTDEVIQARLLEKTENAVAELKSLFAAKGDILRNQLSFTHDTATLKNYENADVFVANYPFAPYHFQLVQKIFESIRKAGATGLHLSRGERSMLDAFQSAAKSVASKSIGALIPLNEFYPCIESFLDTSVKRSIDQASDNNSLQRPFDVELLQTLFLIRYVEILKPNVDNLVTLSINEVDADRIALKRKIEESLVRLEKENLINRNGDLYFFLTNEEREVSREIKNVEISSGEEIKILGETVFDEILKQKSKHRYIPYKRDYPLNRICDDQYFGNKAKDELAVEVITPLHDNYNFFSQGRWILYSSEHDGNLVVKLPDHKALAAEIRAYVQTEKYIRNKSDAAASTTLKTILRDRADENRLRKGRLKDLVEQLIPQADFYAMGKQLEIKEPKAVACIEEGLNHLIQNIYNKFGYLQTLHEDPIKEMKQILLTDDVDKNQIALALEKNEPPDIKELRSFIDLMGIKSQPILLNELVERFSKRPYGWPEWEIVLLVAKLFVGGFAHLLLEGRKLVSKEAIAPLSKTAQWRIVKIVKRKSVSGPQIEKARNLGKVLFGTIGPEKEDKLVEFLREGLAGWKHKLDSYRFLVGTGNYPGKETIEECSPLVGSLLDIQDSYEFINAALGKEGDLTEASEGLYNLSQFFDTQLQTWESLRKSLEKLQPNKNELEKDPEAAKDLARMSQILDAPEPYGMLKEVAGLISRVEKKNDEILATNRASAEREIDKKIDVVKTLLAEHKAPPELSNKALTPLQNIKKKVQVETSIPNIITYQVKECVEQWETAQDVIENAAPLGGGEAPKPVKKVETVKPSVLMKKAYLETETDVDEFVDSVKEKILDAVKNNKRVRIS